ncbi:MAG: LolA family protein [Dissulfurimicrobium sp.]|uniref:LolA family protein n=1 Tax=Dissulfurimicrobium TaxID=1769732 RepID=UPI001EDB1FD2|nr:outer membrane lipoprotein carrier protein LolA [Dissulfurimicrobium hydrothermale]UKL13192.1 outer membrane lipoprotein carrier protein LolA [Dissulfurimicrobium hydrothermale]
MLQRRYEKTNDIKADFVQETKPASVNESITATGTVYFKRPYLMRWEYKQPEPQLIVTSGSEVYVYEPEAKQVTVLAREQFLSSEVSRAFFFGKGDINKYFLVGPGGQNGLDPNWSLKLIPLDDAGQVQTIWVGLDPKTHLIKEMWLEDQTGGKIHLMFKNIEVNTAIKDSLFKFVPPKGIDIYRTDDN